MPEVGEQAVGGVDHRRGPRPRRDRALGERRPRGAVRGDHRDRRAEAAAQHLHARPPTSRARPRTATTSPTFAPDRRTGARPCRSPSAVMVTTICSAETVSPPTTPIPASDAASQMPEARPSTTVGRGRGRGRPARAAVPSGPRPSRRCRRGSRPPPCGPPAREPTSRGGSARPGPACRRSRPPGRPVPPPPRRRRRGRAASPRAGAGRAVMRSITPNSPTSATVPAPGRPRPGPSSAGLLIVELPFAPSPVRLTRLLPAVPSDTSCHVPCTPSAPRAGERARSPRRPVRGPGLHPDPDRGGPRRSGRVGRGRDRRRHHGRRTSPGPTTSSCTSRPPTWRRSATR